jgi:quinol-cytochrome oxidoreductase complex cytochrome b subunit
LNAPPNQQPSLIKGFFNSWSRFFPSPGLLTHAALFVAIGSGIALAFGYDVNRPADSLQVMILSNLGGTFIRAIHYWSSQFFLILAAFHFIDQLSKNGERGVSRGLWLRLTLIVPLVMFLMISGFMLKADRGGVLALQVIKGLLGMLPTGGNTLRFLLLGSSNSLQLIYTHHIATATLLVLIFTLEHAGRVWPEWRSVVYVLASSMIMSSLRLPILQPEGPGAHVKGPWYFVGLQEMLHWTSRPGWILALGGTIFLTLCILPLVSEPGSKMLKRLMAAGFIVYVGLSVMGWFFRGADWQWVVPWGAP